MQNFLDKLGMKISSEKIKVMIINASGDRKTVKIEEKVIENVNLFEYLGSKACNNGLFEEAIQDNLQ